MKDIHTGLHKRFTNNLNWKVKLFFIYKQVIEFISFITRGNYPWPDKVQFFSIILFCNSFTIQQFSN